MAALATSLNVKGAKLGVVRAENLHVTLNFLGDLDDGRLERVCEAVGEVAAKSTPFEFTVGGVQCKPPRGIPRIVWVDVDDPSGGLCLLQENLTTAMEALGFPRERRAYRPHVTLARVRYAGDSAALRSAVQQEEQADFGKQIGQEVMVYLSELRPGGPVYAPAARVTLGGAESPSHEV